MRYRRIALLIGLGPLAACGSGVVDHSIPHGTLEQGTLEVTARTSGDAIDSDGYTITVTGEGPRALEANGALSYQGLTAGVHWVGLESIAANCRVLGGNPRSVTITAAAVTRLEFAISCGIPGTLTVRVSTTGDAPDPDGYFVTLQRTGAQLIGTEPVGLTGAVSFGALTDGYYEVRLSGVAINCYLVSYNPQSVFVSATGLGEARFEVGCRASPPEALVVLVEVGCFAWLCLSEQGTLAGNLFVDDLPPQPISGTVVLSPVVPGMHVVRLESRNCWVSGEQGNAAATVVVPAGGVGSTRFQADCSSAH